MAACADTEQKVLDRVAVNRMVAVRDPRTVHAGHLSAHRWASVPRGPDR